MLINLVRTARLELAQLSPLPPQDSVSTNFTTSAVLNCLECMRKPYGFLAFQPVLEFTLKFGGSRPEAAAQCPYFVGICAAPDAAGAGGAGTAALLVTGALVPGICPAPEAATAGAGAVIAAPSRTLEPERGCALPK